MTIQGKTPSPSSLDLSDRLAELITQVVQMDNPAHPLTAALENGAADIALIQSFHADFMKRRDEAFQLSLRHEKAYQASANGSRDAIDP